MTAQTDKHPILAKGCKYCKADAAGNYEMYRFDNPKKNGEAALISFYGAEVNVMIDLGKGDPPIRLRVPINRCPICGTTQERSE